MIGVWWNAPMRGSGLASGCGGGCGGVVKGSCLDEGMENEEGGSPEFSG